MNYTKENLERLCRPCHRQQHSLEEQLSLRVLVQGFGIPMRAIHDEARNLLMSGVIRISDHAVGLAADVDIQPIIDRLLALRNDQ